MTTLSLDGLHPFFSDGRTHFDFPLHRTPVIWEIRNNNILGTTSTAVPRYSYKKRKHKQNKNTDGERKEAIHKTEATRKHTHTKTGQAAVSVPPFTPVRPLQSERHAISLELSRVTNGNFNFYNAKPKLKTVIVTYVNCGIPPDARLTNKQYRNRTNLTQSPSFRHR